MSYHFSHSKLQMYDTCPMQYKFKVLDKVELPDRVSADIFLGNAVHRQLEIAYKLASDNVLYPLEDMIKAYKETWDKTGKEKIRVSGEYQTIENYIENGEKMLRRYYDKYKPFDNGTLLGAEMKLRFELEGTPFSFSAQIDRLWKRDDGVIEIYDYKTGKRLPFGVDDKSFYKQMGIYQLAIMSKYPHFEKIEIAQYFLRHEEEIRHCFTPDQLDEFSEELRQSSIEIINAERLSNFPTKEGNHCGFCDYESVCPAKRHHQILQKEEGTDGAEISSAEAAQTIAEKYIEIDEKIKSLNAEKDALRNDLIVASEELEINKFSADSGDVSVKKNSTEEFVKKTSDKEAHLELSQLVRDWKIDEALKLDERVLYKDFYRAERLTPEKLEKLSEFIIKKDNYRITVNRNNSSNEE